MRLRILSDIHFADIRRSVPVGILEEVSTACLFFAKETCNVARKHLLFADMQANPDHSDHSLLTPAEACCYHPDHEPGILIFIRPKTCTEITALHEIMHAYLYFAEGYRSPRHLNGHFPFHVRLFAGIIGNIAMDMHTNERLRQRGFAIDSLRDGYFQALEEHLALFKRPGYADDVGIQWQVGVMWGHMLAGEHFYHPTEKNLYIHWQLNGFCRKHSRGTIRFRDLLVETVRKTGYNTLEKVGRFVDEITPELFKALGERFRPEYLRRSRQQRRTCREHEIRSENTVILNGAQA